MTNRDAIVNEIKALIEPLMSDSGYCKALDHTRGILGPTRPLRIFNPENDVEFEGFVLTEMIALSEDGPITDAYAGGAVITSFDDLPVEDLVMLKRWAEGVALDHQPSRHPGIG